MKEYKLFRSVSFQKNIEKYEEIIKDRIDKIEEKLKYNPEYGTPLGTKWFRESRFENYRIYYLVYEDLQAIYMVAISNKKNQQSTINTIKLFLKFLREEIEILIERDNTKRN